MELALDDGFVEIRLQPRIGQIGERLHALAGKADEIEEAAPAFAGVAGEEIIEPLLEFLLEGGALLLRDVGELFAEELLPIALDGFIRSVFCDNPGLCSDPAAIRAYFRAPNPRRTHRWDGRLDRPDQVAKSGPQAR